MKCVFMRIHFMVTLIFLTFHFSVGGVPIQHAAKMKANATSVKGSNVMYLVNIYT